MLCLGFFKLIIVSNTIDRYTSTNYNFITVLGFKKTITKANKIISMMPCLARFKANCSYVDSSCQCTSIRI
jgi:hypothetical protein